MIDRWNVGIGDTVAKHLEGEYVLYKDYKAEKQEPICERHTAPGAVAAAKHVMMLLADNTPHGPIEYEQCLKVVGGAIAGHFEPSVPVSKLESILAASSERFGKALIVSGLQRLREDIRKAIHAAEQPTGEKDD